MPSDYHSLDLGTITQLVDCGEKKSGGYKLKSST